MIVYLPRFVLAAQTKAIRIALNEAGHKVEYIGHHPTDGGLTGPRIENAGTLEDDKGAGSAWDLVDEMLDTVPHGYYVRFKVAGPAKGWHWYQDASLAGSGTPYDTQREVIAAAWAHKGQRP